MSESSLKRWVDSGRIEATRTDGGHRKIELREAVRFIRDTGAPVARPELLDMPEVALAQRATHHDDVLLDHLARGDALGARGWLLSRYLRGETIAALCDGPIREAMHRIGELWNHDHDGVFIEHRATDACVQALSHLRNMLEVPGEAPTMLGATPSADPYLLPSIMAATVLTEAGARAVNLGPDTPVSALERAFAHHQPRLVWISASAPMNLAGGSELGAWVDQLPATSVIVVGGRESATIPTTNARVRRLVSMQELAVLGAAIVAGERR